MNAMTLPEQEAALMPLRVLHKEPVATDVVLFELAAADGALLPAFDAGSHVTVLTPAGLTRRYSLCGAPGETGRYRIAVKREAQGLGGSASLVDRVAQGDTLPTSLPRNYFPLHAGAQRSLLIAGGIGITPVMSMAAALAAQGADFRVVYLARTPAATPFGAALAEAPFGDRVLVHHSHGDPSRRFDLAALLREAQPGTHVYCCGPRSLMQSVRELTAHWPGGQVHFEDFGTSEQPQAGEDRPFTVSLARSGRSFEVPVGKSILDVLRAAGVPAPSSCESGTCGSCRTGLVSGCADHRDYVLEEDEHERQIMICVSRAKGDRLEIDL